MLQHDRCDTSARQTLATAIGWVLKDLEKQSPSHERVQSRLLSSEVLLQLWPEPVGLRQTMELCLVTTDKQSSLWRNRLSHQWEEIEQKT
jgi:hypothetical protein